MLKLLRSLLGLKTPEEERQAGFNWARKTYRNFKGDHYESVAEVESHLDGNLDHTHFDRGAEDFLKQLRRISTML